jgi:sec-independent protein translocase protein TatA
MAITDPLNVLIIVSLFAIIIIWGPERLPEIVRQINRLRAEYTKATTGVMSQLESLTKPLPPNVLTADPRMLSNDNKVIEVARKLGVMTQGKTKGEITNEILNLIGDNNPPAEKVSNGSGEASSSAAKNASSNLSEQK